MIYAFTWDASVVEVCIQFSLFYIQTFLNEFLEKKPATFQEQVSDCFFYQTGPVSYSKIRPSYYINMN